MATYSESRYIVKHFVEKSLEDRHLQNIILEISSGVNGEGYMGDIVFAKVIGNSKKGNKEEYHLVLKFGKKNKHLREIMPVREVYQQEIYMYTVVIPFIQKFRKDRGLEELNFIPKCYGTFDGQESETIVLENLRQSGYVLHNKFTHMNVNHMRLVLEALGQWHAVSFAIQDQNKEEYDRISSSLINILDKFMKNEDTKSSLKTATQRVRKVLNEHKDYELVRKFNKVMGNGDTEDHLDIMWVMPDKTVISHGDCWNNNFMFKYYEANTMIPEKVEILDWQLSFPRSPVFDLSYLIYAVASKKELDQFDALMDVYYGSLSDNVRKLGSDPAKLFAKEELLDHWRKYSLIGFLYGIVVAQFAMCEFEDAPSLGDLTTDQNLATITTNIKIKQKDGYYKRIRDIVEHYISYNDV